MLAGESVETVEKKFVRLDGTSVPDEVIAAPFTNNGKHAEEKIRRQVNLLTALKDIDRIIVSTFELALAYDATIDGWSRALDLRDKETEDHTQRVTQRTLELARLFVGIPDKEMVQVRYGAL